MDSHWKKLNTHREYLDRVLSVEHREFYFAKENASMNFTVVNTNDWVTIIPITLDDKFVLVKQFRVGTEETTYEFPGGAVNKGEDKLKAALRELREETGIEPIEIKLLGEIHPNPAFMSNKAYVYLAKGCEFKYDLNLDMFEDIELITLTKNELEDYIRSGMIKHSIVLAAYSLFLVDNKV
ncbi:NUDIX hydrolase [Deferribacterales bacterium Es71-Z0220]|jgi:8-oxo-dGTP pyrophosphatase MutT (NUDIX family)|uniref:NUDIX hydrolase n=1 Tax=Deferrivibrio essentukiensis TaxID=2880922 RepID=UPI001F62252E|nr:NUDIX hydrolase [Deferrivibrio essentukiensis]MBZ4672092.1 hydrolase [Deferribacteraceae bacterium]MCB4204376.1 NUDIX hydrolase [Deferrivibrio essentukiensis]